MILIMAETKRLDHSDFGPLFDENSRVLILGSFPSVKSREQKFYYGHPQNRFWKVLQILTDPALKEAVIRGESAIPALPALTVPQKKELALKNRIALWDTIESCVITGSSDSSIKDVVPNDLSLILGQCDIRAIFCNGSASYDLFMKTKDRQQVQSLPPVLKLPSTSPANAAWSLQRLAAAWDSITPYL